MLFLSNISSKDNLHNLTCEAENQAGPGEEMVQLDIECKCLLEVMATARWGHFLFLYSAGRVDSQRKEKCSVLISF